MTSTDPASALNRRSHFILQRSLPRSQVKLRTVLVKLIANTSASGAAVIGTWGKRKRNPNQTQDLDAMGKKAMNSVMTKKRGAAVENRPFQARCERMVQGSEDGAHDEIKRSGPRVVYATRTASDALGACSFAVWSRCLFDDQPLAASKIALRAWLRWSRRGERGVLGIWSNAHSALAGDGMWGGREHSCETSAVQARDSRRQSNQGPAQTRLICTFHSMRDPCRCVGVSLPAWARNQTSVVSKQSQHPSGGRMWNEANHCGTESLP